MLVGPEIGKAVVAELEIPRRPGAVGSKRIQVLVKEKSVDRITAVVGVVQPGTGNQNLRIFVQNRLYPLINTLLDFLPPLSRCGSRLASHVQGCTRCKQSESQRIFRHLVVSRG